MDPDSLAVAPLDAVIAAAVTALLPFLVFMAVHFSVLGDAEHLWGALLLAAGPAAFIACLKVRPCGYPAQERTFRDAKPARPLCASLSGAAACARPPGVPGDDDTSSTADPCGVRTEKKSDS